MSFDDLLASFERLIRFKYPNQNYDRFFREILVKFSISPKISLKNYYKYSPGSVNFLATQIWNESLDKIAKQNETDYFINKYLLFEETKAFCAKEMLKDIAESENIIHSTNPLEKNCSDSIESIKSVLEVNGYSFDKEEFADFDDYETLYFKLRLNYPLKIKGFLDLAEAKINRYNYSGALKRLIYLNNLYPKDVFENTYKESIIYREKYGSLCPEKLVLLVEGTTEEKLLPLFAKANGLDFDKSGVKVISSGGKNQVARIYKKYCEKIKLPILIVMDKDAQNVSDEIESILKDKDRIFLIPDGEFEDIIPENLIKKAINKYYSLQNSVSLEEIRNTSSKVETFEKIWKEKGFGEFNKSDFADIIADNISKNEEITATMEEIFSIIKNMCNGQNNLG